MASSFWLLSRRTFLMVLLFCSLSASEDVTMDTESWLRQYGYLAPQNSTDSSSMHSIQDLSEAISDMQRFYSLEVTGQMDQQTITAMKRPRCGVPDKTTNAGQSDYKVQGNKWNKHHLTVSIENFAPNMAWYETYEAIRRAFKVWEKVSPLTFEEIPYQEIHFSRRDVADIMISFASGSHKGHGPFEGTTLAHAFYPGAGIGGDVHFNSDRQWSVANQNVRDSYNVFLVAVHELGHSLGLDHSSDQSSIMYPWYHWMETEDFQLPADDRRGIQHIYRDKSCPSGWKSFGSSCYYRSRERKPWQQSREECLNQGADLVIINSREEQEFIRGWIPGGDESSWIGLKRTDRGGRWTWLDGTPLTTQYWDSGYPLNDEHRNCAYCFHSTDPGTWGNLVCSFTRVAICEK